MLFIYKRDLFLFQTLKVYRIQVIRQRSGHLQNIITFQAIRSHLIIQQISRSNNLICLDFTLFHHKDTFYCIFFYLVRYTKFQAKFLLFSILLFAQPVYSSHQHSFTISIIVSTYAKTFNSLVLVYVYSEIISVSCQC